MKTIKIIFLIPIIILAIVANSYSQDYKHSFNINEKGEVYNKSGVKLGWIENDTIIKNAKGETVGKIEKSELKDNVGNKIGAATEDGSLYDSKGKVEYTISTPDRNGICLILKSNGKQVGTVHENYKRQGACALHCLQNN